ncbi:MAG: hypothetical protein NC332_03740, partial [Firmicutes bacterium]|nr:hypothetical protein [Bacillota bacterium]
MEYISNKIRTQKQREALQLKSRISRANLSIELIIAAKIKGRSKFFLFATPLRDLREFKIFCHRKDFSNNSS